MTDIVSRYSEVAYALLVAGAGLIWPPLCLAVAGLYFVVLAVVADRRTPTPEVKP